MSSRRKRRKKAKGGDVKRIGYVVPVDRNPGDVKKKTKEKVAVVSGVSVSPKCCDRFRSKCR